MAMRKLIVFKHDSELGNAPSHKLFELVKVSVSKANPPRSFGDYSVSIDKTDVPAGVTIIEKL
jgi:CRISPR-associated protein Csd2